MDAVFTGWTQATPSAGVPIVTFVAAVDGRNGSRLWRSLPLESEGYGFSLNLLDIDGDGHKEVAVTNSVTNVYPVTWTPLEDQAEVSIFDLATGTHVCRFPTERLAFVAFTGNIDGAPGDEIVVPTLGGAVYNFSGGAPGCGPDPEVPPMPVQLTALASTKTHGTAGEFAIDLPWTGPVGIECRSGGAAGDYIMVFTFSNELDSVNGASVTSGSGAVTNNRIDVADPTRYIVDLTGISTAQTITVSLTNVSDIAGNRSAVVSGSMGVLVGDVNGSGRVDAADVSSVRQQTLQPIGTSNFRNDLNASGRIDAADVSIARQQTLTSLP
jgi:hypothetical protein